MSPWPLGVLGLPHKEGPGVYENMPQTASEDSQALQTAKALCRIGASLSHETGPLFHIDRGRRTPEEASLELVNLYQEAAKAKAQEAQESASPKEAFGFGRSYQRMAETGQEADRLARRKAWLEENPDSEASDREDLPQRCYEIEEEAESWAYDLGLWPVRSPHSGDVWCYASQGAYLLHMASMVGPEDMAQDLQAPEEASLGVSGPEEALSVVLEALESPKLAFLPQA